MLNVGCDVIDGMEVGVDGEMLFKVCVMVVFEKGKVNKVFIEFLVKFFKLLKLFIFVIFGDMVCKKIFCIGGDMEEIVVRFEVLLECL